MAFRNIGDIGTSKDAERLLRGGITTTPYTPRPVNAPPRVVPPGGRIDPGNLPPPEGPYRFPPGTVPTRPGYPGMPTFGQPGGSLADILRWAASQRGGQRGNVGISPQPQSPFQTALPAQATPRPQFSPQDILRRIIGGLTPRGYGNMMPTQRDWLSSIISGLGAEPGDAFQTAFRSWPTAPNPALTTFGSNF